MFDSKKLGIVGLASIVTLWGGVALAAAPAPEVDLAGFLKAIIDAAKSSQWLLAASLGLVGLVWLARTYGAKWLPWLGSRFAGVALTILGGTAGALVSAIYAGTPFSWGLLLDGLMVAISASGLWSLGKNTVQAAIAPKAE